MFSVVFWDGGWGSTSRIDYHPKSETKRNEMNVVKAKALTNTAEIIHQERTA